MTGRGRGRAATAPVIPTDPSLISRPVPPRRAFKTHAFGPGSAAELETQRYTSEMAIADRRACGPTYHQGHVYYPELDDLRRLLELIDSWADTDFEDDVRAPRPVDRTWGYYVFLTSYEDATLAKVERAMHNWVQVVERFLTTREGPDDKKEELRRRFRLDLIKDEEELVDASDDRVRENFRALMHDLDLLSETRSWLPQCRYSVCLVIDAAAVDMLAGLQFFDDRRKEYDTFRDLTVKAIDANWNREEDREEGRETYRGVGQLSINCLQQMYLGITRDACNKAMEDLHPLTGYPGE